MKKLLLATLIVLFTSNVQAQSESFESYVQKLIQISQIESNDERLSEYDLLAEEARLLLDRLNQSESAGDWQVQTKTNPLDDTKTVVGVIEASQGTNEYGRSPVLVARCQSFEINFYINWGQYLGDNARVTYRLGDDESQTSRWSLSTDSQATFFPRGVTDFLKEMQNHDRFVAQITPYNSSPITAVFNIGGGESIIPDILSCGN
ncbi:type VI secretion system-associated protein TagO [Fodinibius saliphilus]|uniref:type VI secretion system-associated protein TagO n=1 Tax=Fodinibius saliphilus TaxID=1920650 RepID=UPI00148622E5|nr:type VI secretion system-associated protein TagO [Fodinibius saliphilus]